jgi:hypothetical protein
MTIAAVILFTAAGALAAGALAAAACGRRRLAYATLGAVAGTVVCVAAVRVCTYISPRPGGNTRTGISVDIWGVEVFRREGGLEMQKRYSRLGSLLELGALAFAAFGAGAFGERLASLCTPVPPQGPGRA